MFEKTFAFWRRIVGQRTVPTKATANEERRLWVRYPTDLQGQVQLPKNDLNEKILANVRDLSLGGANLLVDRPLQPGQMLSLELPTASGEIHTVMACVVRAVAQAPGQWALGCVFSRELDSEVLGTLGARKPKAERADQRVWVRYDCVLMAHCRKFGDPVSAAQPVKVLNISASGIGLLVQPAIETGSMLTVDLLDKTGRKAFTILACIVHAAQRADGRCALGCNFIRELTEEELQSLV